MPIDANLSFLNPPNVEVEVTDVGGGSGTKKVMDLVLSFDPKFVKVVNAAGGTHSKGLITWKKVSCPANKKTFKLKLKRKKAGQTYVVVAAVNPFTGKGDVEGLPFPATQQARRKA